MPSFLYRYKEGFILIGMMIIAAIVTRGVYLQPGNLTDILRTIAPVAIMAMGMTFVILTAGIDLSVGSILALGSVGSAALVMQVLPGMPIIVAVPIAILAALLVGGLCGAVQGALIARLDIQPFIITLAGFTGFRGLAKLVTDNRKIQLNTDGAQELAAWLSQKEVIIGILIIVCIVSYCLLRFTVFGRYVRAVGDNERASHYAGLPVRRMKLAVYSLSGMLAGLAGLLVCARNRTGDANFGIMTELEAIAMVVIGGTSLAGGRGSMSGTILGALILGTVTNVLGLNNVDSNQQSILMAVIIILAVALQKTRQSI